MASGLSFGAQYFALPTVHERLAFETAESRRVKFREVDAVVDRLVLRALHGQRVVEPLTQRRSEARVRLAGEDSREVVSEHFALERQQARGAWYRPKSTRLEVGFIHLAYWYKTKPRHLMALATEETAAPDFSEVDSVVIWAALEPVFDALSLPLRLRAGRWLGEKPVEKQQPYWTKSIEPFYEALGLGGAAFRAFAPDTGWAEVKRQEIEARRGALLEPWSDAAMDTVARLRSLRVGQLVDRYYARARQGKALRSRVLNDRAAERTLTSYFGGDWLAFLDYLGEEPHADEQVVRTLPQPRLMVTSSERAASVAAEHGLPTEEVERMLAAYWGQSEGTSPPEQRVRVLKQLWRDFDEKQAQQASGMKALVSIWSDFGDDADSAEESGGARASWAELVEDVQRLWATKLNPRNPERLVTEPFSKAAASAAFGPALDFWYRASLNAWNMCEGGGSHSELEDFEQYMQRTADGVAEVGFPIGPTLFEELRAAESKLGPVEQVMETTSEEHTELFTISMGVSRTRRDGFEILRDIITRHRRQWAERHLDDYLQTRWHQELQMVGVAYHRHAADRAKAPTVRQFATMAKDAASHWFAGDLTGVYGALGLTSPMTTPTYERILPDNLHSFRSRVAALLREKVTQQRAQLDGQDTEILRFSINQVAYTSADWVELYEALGEPPTLKQFGTPRFRNSSSRIWEDLDDGWKTFSDTIQTALEEFRNGTMPMVAAPWAPAPPASNSAGDEAEGNADASPEEHSAPPRSHQTNVLASPTQQNTAEGNAQPPKRHGLIRRLRGR